MKYLLTIITTALFTICQGQNIEEIKIPRGVVYKYCDNTIIEKAKKLITESIADTANFTLVDGTLIVGPQLWNRFGEIKKLKEIAGGNATFYVDDKQLKGKMTQRPEDARKVWEEFRKEITWDYKIRKANEDELRYYWSVISFDIEEPLLIVETKEHNYILNMLKKDLKLMWLDEAPVSKSYTAYRSGDAATTNTKGEKETKLENVFLFSDDETLKKNTSVEEMVKLVNKCSAIFDELFKGASKEGKILVKFELNKTQNKIEFAVKGDVDPEILEAFKKRVNAEKFPNSKSDPILFNLLYKINSYNDSE